MANSNIWNPNTRMYEAIDRRPPPRKAFSNEENILLHLIHNKCYELANRYKEVKGI